MNNRLHISIEYTQLFVDFFEALESNEKEKIKQNLSSELWDELFLEITDENRPELYDTMLYLHQEAFISEPIEILKLAEQNELIKKFLEDERK